MAAQDNNASPASGRLPAQGRLVGRMQREYRYYKALLGDPRTPTSAKWLIGGGMSYVLLPFDLIPDFIPIVGKIDDLLIAPALIGLGMKLVPDNVKQDDRSRSRRIRFLYDDKSVGPVLFESEALPGPFGIRVGTGGYNTDLSGPVLFPLLDLMFDYGLVVLANETPSADRFDSYSMCSATQENPGMCKAQVQLDMNFRPLPLMAAVIYGSSDCKGADRFVNTEAAYVTLPPKLRRQIEGLYLRWSPCSEVCLDAVLNGGGQFPRVGDTAHAITGAQFMNLLLNAECRILDLKDSHADKLSKELRDHALQDKVCYTHKTSPGELIAWNPRQVLHIAAEASESIPRFIYPRHLNGTNLGH